MAKLYSGINENNPVPVATRAKRTGCFIQCLEKFIARYLQGDIYLLSTVIQ
jgi:hypothetical protein